jgi:hypothetical protein
MQQFLDCLRNSPLDLQQIATASYSEPEEFSPHFPTRFKIHFINSLSSMSRSSALNNRTLQLFPFSSFVRPGNIRNGVGLQFATPLVTECIHPPSHSSHVQIIHSASSLNQPHAFSIVRDQFSHINKTTYIIMLI